MAQSTNAGRRVLVLVIGGIILIAAVVVGIVAYSANRGRADQLRSDEEGRQRGAVLNAAVAAKGAVPTADGKPPALPPTTVPASGG